jgi:hypothetical protein
MISKLGPAFKWICWGPVASSGKNSMNVGYSINMEDFVKDFVNSSEKHEMLNVGYASWNDYFQID